MKSSSHSPSTAESASLSARVFEISSDADFELIEEFRTEAGDLIKQAERTLLSLAADPADAESLGALSRALHTIKGMAGFVGLNHITHFAHQAETFLEYFRPGRFAMRRADVDIARETISMLKLWLAQLDEALATGRFVASPNVEALLTRLEHPQQSHPSATEILEPAVAEFEPEKSVRIPASRLDHLCRLIEELAAAESTRNTDELRRIAQALAEMCPSLQKIPMAQTFQKMARLLRDLAHQSGKEIHFESAGGDIELDYRLIESLAAPLLHMIRNAADHGIELPRERERLGKPRQGCVRLEAFREDSSLVISLSDDGRGLDHEKILSIAIERGFVEANAALSDGDIHRLIFLPGFSTAEDVSELSGRGVGLDIVRTAVEQLHGAVEVFSQISRGTEFRLRLPLS